MDFSKRYYEVVQTEEDRALLKQEALNMTYQELADKYKITKSKMYTVCRWNEIKAKTPERIKKVKKPKVPKISHEEREITKWASTENNGKIRAVYYNMLKRCHHPDNKGYANYGARGIYVCEEWRKDCKAFYKWARDNGYKEGLTIDRIDNNKGYSPDNCRWTTWKVQTVNRKCTRWIEYKGERHTLKEWESITGISYQILADRIFRYGWTIERALTTKSS